MGLMYDITFLDAIKLDIKPEIIKSIRFNEDEIYMIKFAMYLNKKSFSKYVKELIDQDINNYCLRQEQQQEQQQEPKTRRDEIRNILVEILKENDLLKEIKKEKKELKEIQDQGADAETMDALGDLGIMRR